MESEGSVDGELEEGSGEPSELCRQLKCLRIVSMLKRRSSRKTFGGSLTMRSSGGSGALSKATSSRTDQTARSQRFDLDGAPGRVGLSGLRGRPYLVAYSASRTSARVRFSAHELPPVKSQTGGGATGERDGEGGLDFRSLNSLILFWISTGGTIFEPSTGIWIPRNVHGEESSSAGGAGLSVAFEARLVEHFGGEG